MDGDEDVTRVVQESRRSRPRRGSLGGVRRIGWVSLTRCSRLGPYVSWGRRDTFGGTYTYQKGIEGPWRSRRDSPCSGLCQVSFVRVSNGLRTTDTKSIHPRSDFRGQFRQEKKWDQNLLFTFPTIGSWDLTWWRGERGGRSRVRGRGSGRDLW